MAHTHAKGPASASANQRRVVIALALTGTFMLVELVGGILSGSLALLADAGHMFTDTVALMLAAVAFHISRRPASPQLTYGYQRVQILAAFVNGLSLLLIVGWIGVEAVSRLLAPRPVEGELMLSVAVVGLLVNVVAFAVLHSGDRDNLNIRGAALHVAGDLLGSIAAIVAAVMILYTGWMPIDPILSVVVAALIFKSAWTLTKRSALVLLEGAPEWLDQERMRSEICSRVPGVTDVHHVHVWGLTPQETLLTMHVVIDESVNDPNRLIRDVKALLQRDFGIGHSTIEIETLGCAGCATAV